MSDKTNARIETTSPRGLVNLAIDYWQGAPGNLKGALWLLLASFCFAVMTAAVKHVGQRLPVWEILFIRQLCVIVVLTPTLVRSFPEPFRSNQKGLHLARIGFSILAMATGFTAVIYIPLAQFTAISFARTLFTTVLAILILKEAVGARRWTETLLGFVGVLIVVRPGIDGVDFNTLLAIISAGAVAVTMILTRVMANTEAPMTTMTYQSFGLAIGFGIPTAFYWVTPTLEELVLSLFIGLVMTLAQYTNIRAYTDGEAAALQPIEYTRLIFAGLIGLALFQEFPSAWTIAGSTLIFLGALVSMRGMRPKNAGTTACADPGGNGR